MELRQPNARPLRNVPSLTWGWKECCGLCSNHMALPRGHLGQLTSTRPISAQGNSTDEIIRWQFVVSHYKEKLDWLPQLLKDTRLGRHAGVFIYHKGGSGHSLIPHMENVSNANYFEKGLFSGSFSWKSIANVGREQETFVRHLLAFYNKLAPMTVFLQGNPVHSGTVLRDLKTTIRAMERRRPRHQLSKCGLLGGPLVRALADGCDNHCGIAIGTTCTKLTISNHGVRPISCEEPFYFTNGGMFYVARENVRVHDRALYRKIHRMLAGEARYKRRAPLYPYIFERLWERLLDCKIHGHRTNQS